MQLRTVLHRRFRSDAGTEFLYVATSAAILAVDPLTSGIVDAFAGSEGADDAEWLGRHPEIGRAHV